MKRSAWLVSMVVLAACNPTLRPIVAQSALTLQAAQNPPRVVWAFDTSGSMNDEFAGSGYSRMAAVRQWMSGMGAQLPPARHGAVFFPIDSQCAAPSALDLAIPASPGTSFDAVNDLVQARSVNGGTPTSAVLNLMLSAVPPITDADTFVVLVTDGLPNCNPSNPNNQCQGANPSCRCTLASASSCQVPSLFCSKGCLDDLGAVQAANALAQAGLRLLTVAVDAEANGLDGKAVFNTMTQGLPRRCIDSCGNCESASGLCDEHYFRVLKQYEFDAPAQRLAAALRESGRCAFFLDRDVVADELEVSIGADAVERTVNGWNFDAPRTVRFVGDACARLLAGSETPQILWLPGTRP